MQFQGELGGRLAVAGREIGLDLRLESADVLLVVRHLAADALDQGPILLQTLAALFHLGDRLIVLVLHLGDRIGRPEDVGDFVDLRHQRMPELPQNHCRTVLFRDYSPDKRNYCH